jgi:hypothetical protein
MDSTSGPHARKDAAHCKQAQVMPCSQHGRALCRTAGKGFLCGKAGQLSYAVMDSLSRDGVSKDKVRRYAYHAHPPHDKGLQRTCSCGMCRTHRGAAALSQPASGTRHDARTVTYERDNGGAPSHSHGLCVLAVGGYRHRSTGACREAAQRCIRRSGPRQVSSNSLSCDVYIPICAI